jgi:hypothetical protein
MSNKKSSLHRGSTKMLRAVRLDITVLMEPHETTSELLEFLQKFFCDQGDYQGIEAKVVSEFGNYIVPVDDEIN